MEFDFQVRLWKWTVCFGIKLLDIDPTDSKVSFAVEISWW